MVMVMVMGMGMARRRGILIRRGLEALDDAGTSAYGVGRRPRWMVGGGDLAGGLFDCFAPCEAEFVHCSAVVSIFCFCLRLLGYMPEASFLRLHA